MSDKRATLELLEKEYDGLRKAVDGLDDEQLCRVWFGEWSVKDIIAHVSGWQREIAPALERLARGERPMPEGADYSNTDEWNAKFALAMAPIGPRTVLANWRQAHMNYVRAASGLPEDLFGKHDDGRPKVGSRLVAGSGHGHFHQHAEGIRAWREKEGL